MKKKILFVLPWLPYPLISGGHQAIYNAIFAIKDDYDIYITYKTIRRKDKVDNAFLRCIEVANLFPYYQKSSFIYKISKLCVRKLKSLFWGSFYDQKSYMDKVSKSWVWQVSPAEKGFSLFIHSLCEKYHFDIIQVEMLSMVSNILLLPTDSKKIFVHHEIGFVRRQLEFCNRPYNVYHEACRLFADYNEVALLNRYDMIMTLSSIDAKKLENCGVHVPIRTSFSITTSSLSPTQIYHYESSGKRLVFVGSDSHTPNYSGIMWFLNNCWSEMLAFDNSYKLTIVGNWSKGAKKAIERNYYNVDFLGFVDSLEDVLKNSIMIVPIIVGSGIRMKILEAAAVGTPIVTTSVGVEGIPAENETHCLMADDPISFVDAIKKLRDPALQYKLTYNFGKLIAESYSLEALRFNRLSIYNELLNL